MEINDVNFRKIMLDEKIYFGVWHSLKVNRHIISVSCLIYMRMQ